LSIGQLVLLLIAVAVQHKILYQFSQRTNKGLAQIPLNAIIASPTVVFPDVVQMQYSLFSSTALKYSTSTDSRYCFVS
jgi:hypothetical protein